MPRSRSRLVALAVLVTVLLFQWSWSAAAGVCRHGERETAHFGHHSHGASVHGPLVQDAATPDGSGTQAPSADCASCHVWMAAAVWQPLAPAAQLAPVDFSEPPGRYASVAALRPDRPRWRS